MKNPRKSMYVVSVVLYEYFYLLTATDIFC